MNPTFKAQKTTLRPFAAWLSSALIIPLSFFAAVPSLAQSPELASIEPAARTEAKLTLYTAVSDAPTQEMVKGFEKAYPGIKVEWLRFPSTQMFARYVAETESNVYLADILYSGSSQLYQQRPELFEPLTAQNIPNSKNLIIKAKNDAYVIPEINPHGVTYNTSMVTADDIQKYLKSWKDLTDPRWRGKLTVVDPKISTNVVSWLILMRDTYGPQWIKDLSKNQFKVSNTGTSASQQVAAGAFQLAVPTVMGHSLDVRTQGAPIAVYFPDGPAHGNELGMAISRKAPHPNAARLFANWVLSPEAGVVLCKIDAVPNVEVKPRPQNCPEISPRHVGSNDTIDSQQTREILDLAGIK